MNGYTPYEFTDDDLRLVDDVHGLITAHHDRFVDAGVNLDKRYSVDAMLERSRPPIPESQRQAMLGRILSGAPPDESEVERLAARVGDRDTAEHIVIRSHALGLMLPSRSEWESPGRRLNEARRDLYNEYLPVETPSPDWDWSAHVLLMFWLIVEPRADTAPFRLTAFQEWKWDAVSASDAGPDEIEVPSMPRSVMDFGIVDWPRLLNGVRRAMRCAARLGLQTKNPAQEVSVAVTSTDRSAPTLRSPQIPTAESTANLFVRCDEVWTLRFAGKTVRVPHRKGMEYLKQLVAQAWIEVSAAELAGIPESERPLRHQLQEILDEDALAGFRARLKAIELALEEAREACDEDEQTRLEQEKADVLTELRKKRTRRGTSRPFAGVDERLRQRVGSAMEFSIDAIAGQHKDLARHLRDSIRGLRSRAPMYAPSPTVKWEFEEPLKLEKTSA